MCSISDEFVRRTSRDTDGSVSRVLAKLEGGGMNLTINRIVANSEAVFRPFILMSDAVLNRSVIPAAVREAMILALARDGGVAYEWAEHIPMALSAGLTPKQIEHIETGDLDSLDLPDEHALAITIARALQAGRGIENHDWLEAKRHWGPTGALELILTIGWYGGFVPTLLRAIGLETPDDVSAERIAKAEPM